MPCLAASLARHANLCRLPPTTRCFLQDLDPGRASSVQPPAAYLHGRPGRRRYARAYSRRGLAIGLVVPAVSLRYCLRVLRLPYPTLILTPGRVARVPSAVTFSLRGGVQNPGSRASTKPLRLIDCSFIRLISERTNDWANE